jgi:hypothetical protein
MMKKYNTRKNNILSKKGGRNVTFKKMNCSPLINGKCKIPIYGSCFTDDTLNTIRLSYNKHNPDDTIPNIHGKPLWLKIKNKLTRCNKEDCWLNEIKNPRLREKIDKMSFAPDKPSEWSSNPTEWLSNIDILDVLAQYETAFPHFRTIGPTPIDFDTRIFVYGKCVWEELCTFSLSKYLEKKVTKIGVVFNLDEHHEDGSHWVSLFIDLEYKFLLYFDSNGDIIPKEIHDLTKRIIKQGRRNGMKLKLYKNTLEHQKRNTECGMYSLFFIISMLTGKVPDGHLKTKQDKINYFTESRIPDDFVFKFRNQYFNEIE